MGNCSSSKKKYYKKKEQNNSKLEISKIIFQPFQMIQQKKKFYRLNSKFSN